MSVLHLIAPASLLFMPFQAFASMFPTLANTRNLSIHLANFQGGAKGAIYRMARGKQSCHPRVLLSRIQYVSWPRMSGFPIKLGVTTYDIQNQQFLCILHTNLLVRCKSTFTGQMCNAIFISIADSPVAEK